MILYKGKIFVSAQEVEKQFTEDTINKHELLEWIEREKVVNPVNYKDDGFYINVANIEQSNFTVARSEVLIQMEEEVRILANIINRFIVNLTVIREDYEIKVGDIIYVKGAVKSLTFKVISITSTNKFEIVQQGTIVANASLGKNSLWNLKN